LKQHFRDQFIKRWEEYHRSENSDMDVTLQQCEGGKIFKYLAQHRVPEMNYVLFFQKGKFTTDTP
jgi:hypothetical protein